MSASSFLENAFLNHLWTDPAFAPVDPPLVALVTTPPANADTGSTIVDVPYTNYARVAAPGSSMGAAASGSKSNTSTVTFAECGTTGAVAKGWALVSASSNGDLYLGGMLASNQKSFFADSATNVIHCPAHGYSDDDKVVFYNPDPSLPAPLSAIVEYFVISSTTDTFKVSLTQGGAEVVITSSGPGRVGIQKWLSISNGIAPRINVGELIVSMQ